MEISIASESNKYEFRVRFKKWSNFDWFWVGFWSTLFKLLAGVATSLLLQSFQLQLYKIITAILSDVAMRKLKFTSLIYSAMRKSIPTISQIVPIVGQKNVSKKS